MKDDYYELLKNSIIDYDWVIADNSCENRKASEFSLWTFDDPSVGIFSVQVSPWFKTYDELYSWFVMLKVFLEVEK